MNCTDYLSTMFDVKSREATLDMVVEYKFYEDICGRTLVATGTSGLLWGMALSMRFGNPLCVVRKNNEGSHSVSMVENPPKGDWVFVDDLIDTGATFKRVYKALKDRGYQNGFKGSLLYYSGTFLSPNETIKRLGYTTLTSFSRSLNES